MSKASSIKIQKGSFLTVCEDSKTNKIAFPEICGKKSCILWFHVG